MDVTTDLYTTAEAVKNDQRTYHSEEKCLILGSLETVLKGLQRGRE